MSNRSKRDILALPLFERIVLVSKAVRASRSDNLLVRLFVNLVHFLQESEPCVPCAVAASGRLHPKFNSFPSRLFGA